MIRAVIFDMDGLLVDSEPVWDRSRSEMATLYGKPWGEEDHRAIMGVNSREWAAYMIKRLELSMSSEEVQSYIVGKVAQNYQQRIPFLPGAVEAVQLAAQNFPIGLASGSHRDLIDLVLDHPALRGKFQVVLSADEVARGKPAPDVYLEAAQRMGYSPETCVCLEDSTNGILAGKRAGMKVISVPSSLFPPSPELLAQVDLRLDSLSELTLEMLQSL